MSLNYQFRSIFAPELDSYFAHREACGLTKNGLLAVFKHLDDFISEKCTGKVFTRSNAEEWIVKRDDESPQMHYRRVNATKLFFQFLFPNGYEVFLFDDVKNPPKTFKPHIYTQDEIKRYFLAVDSYTSKVNKYNAVQLPILFRLLYCCGTRIGETLMIRKQDVDLNAGIILLSETKNCKQRYIVLSDELASLMRCFADKTFYMLHDGDYIFRSSKGTRLDRKMMTEMHRDLLSMAGIPYQGNGKGPRIHDWRHTFAVNAFKQMSDNGIDMYVTLPLLSTYMGHGTIMATEYYLRLTLELFPSIEQKMAETAELVFKEADHEKAL